MRALLLLYLVSDLLLQVLIQAEELGEEFVVRKDLVVLVHLQHEHGLIQGLGKINN